ncbi:hypothetical protein DFP73DRAFT_545286 [Morchella snyderi]|nr:hypothetical protein DFP73DRAFT_545286 [Morchella snyderi]
MGCCGSRESPPPPPPRSGPDVDVVYQRAPQGPLDRRPTLPPRLVSLAEDQEAQIAGRDGYSDTVGQPPAIPPKIPHLPPRPTSTEMRDPEHWQHVSSVLELPELDQDVPRLESNPTPIFNAMVARQPMPGGLEYNNHYPEAASTRYRSPPPASQLDPPIDFRARSLSPVSAMDPADLRANSLSPVSMMDPMSRQPSFVMAPQASTRIELEAMGTHIELPATQEAGPHVELPAIPMEATVRGPMQMYHELDGGYGAVEMPVR